MCSKVAFLKLQSQPWVLRSQSDHHFPVQGNRTRMTDIVVCEQEWNIAIIDWEYSVKLAYLNGLVTLWLVPLIAQGNTIRIWGCGCHSPVFKAKQLIRNFTDFQSVLINFLPQFVQAAMYHLVWMPDTGCSGRKNQLFQVMLLWLLEQLRLR